MTTSPVERVRKVVQDAFLQGRLGVMAATFNIAEGKLRQFANGNDLALTHDEVFRIAFALSKGTP